MSGLALTRRRNRACQGGSLRHYLDMLVYPKMSAKVLTTAAEMSRCRRRATFVGLRIGGYEWSDSQLRIIRVLDVCVRLLFRLLGLEFLVHIGAQCLNRLPQAHRLGTRACGTRRALGWCLACHVGLHASEADAEVLADVSRSDALSQVLESRPTLLCRHPCKRLQFVRQLA